jgi:hypothetical protein
LCVSLLIFNADGLEKITDTGLINLNTDFTINDISSFKLIVQNGILRTGLYPIYLWIGKKGDQFQDNIAFDLLDKLYYFNIKSNFGIDVLGYDYSTPHGYFNLNAKLEKC